MSKIRINDLARELEVKSKAILDALPEVGVTEKKTHSSSVEEHEAVKVRAYLRAANEAQAAPKQTRSSRAESDGIKTKIDLSNISRPGDVLNAIRKQQVPVAASAPAARPPVSAAPATPSVSPVKTPPPPPAAPSSPCCSRPWRLTARGAPCGGSSSASPATRRCGAVTPPPPPRRFLGANRQNSTLFPFRRL